MNTGEPVSGAAAHRRCDPHPIPFNPNARHAHVRLTDPIGIRLEWHPRARAPARLRQRISRELRDLAWELSQAEALLHDAHRVAHGPRAYLMPRLELRLPLYPERRRLRLVLTHDDEARVELIDEEGAPLARVRLS